LYQTARRSFKINLAKKCRDDFSVVVALFFCRRKTRKIKNPRAPGGGATDKSRARWSFLARGARFFGPARPISGAEKD
jgi:hypothetical protein